MKNIALMLTAVLALALTAGCKEKAAEQQTEVGAAVDNAAEQASEAAAAAADAAAVAADNAAEAAGQAVEAAGEAAQNAGEAAVEAGEAAADAAAEAMSTPEPQVAPVEEAPAAQ